MNMISPITDAAGAITGAAMSGGREARASCSFSATICRARWASVPQANSTVTIDRPILVAERTRRTPGAPLSAASIGKLTWASTSTGAMPWASVTTVTVGAVRSGNTSTGVRSVSMPPQASSSTAPSTTNRRLRSDHWMRVPIMIAGPQWAWPVCSAREVDSRIR